VQHLIGDDAAENHAAENCRRNAVQLEESGRVKTLSFS